MSSHFGTSMHQLTQVEGVDRCLQRVGKVHEVVGRAGVVRRLVQRLDRVADPVADWVELVVFAGVGTALRPGQGVRCRPWV